jgi:hypothetical protein
VKTGFLRLIPKTPTYTTFRDLPMFVARRADPIYAIRVLPIFDGGARVLSVAFASTRLLQLKRI